MMANGLFNPSLSSLPVAFASDMAYFKTTVSSLACKVVTGPHCTSDEVRRACAARGCCGVSCSISQIMPTTRMERRDNGAEGDGAEGGWENRWAASQEGKKRAYGNGGKTHGVGPAGVEGLRELVPTDRERGREREREREKKGTGVNSACFHNGARTYIKYRLKCARENVGARKGKGVSDDDRGQSTSMVASGWP